MPQTHTNAGHGGTGRKLFTTTEVAALFRVTRRTVRAWIHEGKLRAKVAGGRFRFTAAHIKQCLDSMPETKARIVKMTKGDPDGKARRTR